nr:filamentous hemagglutinin N-terminal domain-containing protein [Rhodoblastus sphagnicola]
MLRATQALQAVQAAKSAARAAASAAPTTVTDGLSPGGLIVDPRVAAGVANLWVNANLPTQSSSNGRITVTAQQTAQRAIMTWRQFNVGKNTTLHFDQTGGNSANGNSWVALNRIDATGSPSEILGQIKAEGTVLLINPNGIIFTGSSQINVHTLIASSLDLNSYSGYGVTNVGVFDANGGYRSFTVNGATFFAPVNENNGNTQFLASGLYANASGAVGGPTSLIVSAGNLPSGQANQGIVVQPGAVIATDVSGFDNGGYVALLGPKVSNAGSITTSAGQIILAASSTIGLTQPSSSNTAITVTIVPASGYFPSVNNNGLGYTPAAISGGGLVSNEVNGLLSSPRGNITLAGDWVNQFGVARASTSITRAGSIVINANQRLTLGSDSVSLIDADENGETIPSDAASLANFVAPKITITAANMDMQGATQDGPGALVLAPGAAMTVMTGGELAQGGPTSPVGRVVLEAGSAIDLAGMNATASVTDTLYTFKVTANDVADTPLARSLIGKTVTIDLSRSGTRADGETWVGSPLFASSGAGYLANVPKTIDQLLTKGGALTFAGASGGFAPFKDVLQASGSVVNVSGGILAVAGGEIHTTQVIGADGRRYDISSADPFITNQIAGGFVVNHPHWGVTETYDNGLLATGYYKPGYLDGISAGSLSVTAGTPILEGATLASAWTSPYQAQLALSDTGAGGAQLTPDQLPVGGALSITSVGANGGGGASIILRKITEDVLGADFAFGSTLTLPTVDLVTSYMTTFDTSTWTRSPPIPVVTTTPVIAYSTDMLSAGGFGSITIGSSSALSMEKGAVLKVADGGNIKLSNATTIDGSLIAHGGKITITGYTSNYVPPVNAVTIGADALIDVSGLWVNDTGARGDAILGAAHIDGGSVTIQTYAEGANESGVFYYDGTPNITVDATQSIVLAAGSVIDLTSGGYVGVTGKLKTAASGLPAGAGGNLALLTYAQNPSYANKGWDNPYADMGNSAPYSQDGANRPNQANVFMDGAIYSGGLATGGAFALQAPTIQIGGVSTVTSYASSSARAGEIDLPASFFAANGFSSYALTSTWGGVTVTAGASVLLQQKNYLLSGSVRPATGARLRDVAAFGVATDGLRQPVNLSLTQQPFAYADINHFVSGAAANPTDLAVNAGILVDSGAAIVGEAKAAITLTAGGPLTMLGSITAHGGSITLTNNGAGIYPSFIKLGSHLSPGQTEAPLDIWIGSQAVLDVSGSFVANPLVTTYLTGAALDGGSIAISGGPIVAMPGSLFDISGISASVEEPGVTKGMFRSGFVARQVWSNGGSLSLTRNQTTDYYLGSGASSQNLYFDGTVRASGGAPLASGGALTIGGYFDGGASYASLIISQSDASTTALSTAALASNGNYPVTLSEITALLTNSAITANSAHINADLLNHSGFASATLMATTIAFSGNVDIALPGALTLAGNLALLPTGGANPNYSAASIGATTVNIDAGSLLLVSNTSKTPTLSDGTLNLHAAAQIDLAGYITISNAADVHLTSGGDIRLLAETDPQFSLGNFYWTNINTNTPSPYFKNVLDNLSLLTSQSTIQTPGLLQVPNNLTLTGREVYPATDSAFVLMSRGLGAGSGAVNTITIASNGQTPGTPLSVNGAILVDAPSIVQAGALMAPLGAIQLGFTAGVLPTLWTDAPVSAPHLVATNAVTLAAGSLTSVSAAGLEIPFGATVNGIDWSAIDRGVADYVTSNNGTVNFPTVTAPPSKSIVLKAAVVDSRSGAVVDVSGGGDIYATEFVAGTGGSRNVLLQSSADKGQTVYALAPSYAAAVAASDPYYDQSLTVGASVTLPGGNGIAAGAYTLLPASYATLPGAYRVVVTKTDTGNSRSFSTMMADGSILMTGTLGNAVTGARSSQTALLQIQSNAVWNKYSEIDIAHANSYFAVLAAKTGAVTPYLPIDGGVLQVNATTALTLAGSFNFAPASGGRGGEADIGGSNLLVLASDLAPPTADAAAGYIVLDADQLSHLGATTLLLGGASTLGAKGRTIVASAGNLEIETDADHPLSAPDLLLVSKPNSGGNGLTIDSGSVVRASGTVPTGTELALRFGSGSLMRVSNGIPVVITQTGNTADGVAVAIGAAPGTAVVDAASGAAVVIDATSFALATSGSSAMAANTLLQARNFDLSGNIINLGSAPAGAAGLTISPALIAAFAGADTVSLHSAAGIDFFGPAQLGNAAAPIGLLSLDAGGLYGDGAAVGISATAIMLSNSRGSAAGASLGAGGGLAVNASSTITLGAGTKLLDGFAGVVLTAGEKIIFAGSGSLDAGTAAVTLATPNVVAAAGGSQSLATTGLLSILPGARGA